jgi:beta-ureidopropionase / N-carbamoyl-L-amino-acid hydrolase
MTAFASALDAATAESWALMARIGADTRGAVGITRAPYDAAEQRAAEATRAVLHAEGIATEYDAFGNLHATLPGTDPSLPAVGLGSHFDSVPDGGNYDGLAGVMAGLAILLAARRTGLALRRPLRLLGLRGEESPWYGTAYLGSRMALGHVPFATMGRLVRGDTGRTLADHMAALGFAGQEAPSLSPATLACWLELHIEQGPLLIGRDVPIGIATAIRGNIRHAQARCLGEWAHSAAVPQAFRHDAVVATSELVMAIDAYWRDRIAAGDDNFVATIGIFSTQPELHAMTKVPGEVAFTLNLGGTDAEVLRQSGAHARACAAEIAARRGVRFELGPDTGSQPTPLDAALVDRLDAAAAALGLGRHRMPTVGHDAGMFAQAGIPAAMVLVRNQNGSHNPHEALEEADYAAGVAVLARTAVEVAEMP